MDVGESIGVVEEVCLAETKVRVTFPCNKALDFAMELDYEEEVLSVKLKYEKLFGYCRICHMLTHADSSCPLRVTKPAQDREFQRRPDWDDKRDGRDRRFRNCGEDMRQMGQNRNKAGPSQVHNVERSAALPARPPLQRQLLPEFTTAIEKRIETKNWVVTAFGKAGKDGVVVDYDLVRSFVPPKDAPEEAAKGPSEIADTVKSALATLQDGDGTASSVESGEVTQTAEGTARTRAMAVARLPMNRPERWPAAVGLKIDGLHGPRIRLGPGTKFLVRADRGGRRGCGTGDLVAAGPSSAPGGTEAMVCYRRDTQGHKLGIEDIISPLKELYEVTIGNDQPRSRGKKVKSFQNALLPRKKIVNSSSRKGKMLNKSLLSMSDFDVVARAKGSKEGLNKGVCLTKDALVGGPPPVKE
ncbi:unnamed protein product [Cochlearia groenlandica]